MYSPEGRGFFQEITFEKVIKQAMNEHYEGYTKLERHNPKAT